MQLYFLALLCTAMNIGITALFCCLTLTGKHKVFFSLLSAISVPIVLVILDTLRISGIVESHPMRFVGTTGVCILLVFLFFQDSPAKKLFIFAVGASLQTFSTFLIAFPLAVHGFFEPVFSNVKITPQFLFVQYAGALCYFFFVLLVSKFTRSRSAGRIEGWNLLFLFISVQTFFLLTSSVAVSGTLPMILVYLYIFISIVCIVVDLAMFYVIDDINKKAALEAAAEFYKNQLSMQLSLYENFSAYGENLRQTKQELVESLSQAQQSLKSRDYSSAEKMLEPLPQELEKLRTISYCEHRIVNALLFVKQRKMKQYGISFDCRVRLAEDCFVESSHLCRILSNLLDNAIEACREIPNAEIHLTCIPVKNTLLIKTANPVSGSIPIQKNGFPASTKKEPGHGKGLASVKEIAQHYNGSLQVQTDSRFFRATVILFPDGRNA